MERPTLLAQKKKNQKIKAELLCANIMMKFSLCLIWSDFNFQKNQSGSRESVKRNTKPKEERLLLKLF